MISNLTGNSDFYPIRIKRDPPVRAIEQKHSNILSILFKGCVVLFQFQLKFFLLVSSNWKDQNKKCSFDTVTLPLQLPVLTHLPGLLRVLKLQWQCNCRMPTQTQRPVISASDRHTWTKLHICSCKTERELAHWVRKFGFFQKLNFEHPTCMWKWRAIIPRILTFLHKNVFKGKFSSSETTFWSLAANGQSPES